MKRDLFLGIRSEEGCGDRQKGGNLQLSWQEGCLLTPLLYSQRGSLTR
jgi:hypothetical protein